MEDQITRAFQWMRRHRDEERGWSARLSRAYADQPVQMGEIAAGETVDELALPALYGRYGVLPDYFTDELLHREDGDAAMRAFLDLFNRRIFRAFFEVWLSHELFLESALDPDTPRGEEEAFLMRRITGQMAAENLPAHIQGLRWNRLELYRAEVRTSSGLISLVRSFFPDLEVRLETFVPVVREIPPDQRPVLGKQPIRIGLEGNLLTGKTLRDVCGGVRLVFENLDYDRFMKLQPLTEKEREALEGGEGPSDALSWRLMLEEIVEDYTRGTPNCMISLELRADEIPAWQLGSRAIGRDIWLRSAPMTRDYVVDGGRL